jgi:hypothetical protein
MLTIRNSQMQAFVKARRSAFLAALVKDAERTLLSAGHRVDPADLPARIDALIDAVLAAGVNRECDVARLVLLVCRYFGPDLSPMPPPALDILHASGVAPEHKLQMLEEFLGEFGPARDR